MTGKVNKGLSLLYVQENLYLETAEIYDRLHFISPSEVVIKE